MKKSEGMIKSVCPYCGVGCGMIMQVVDNEVVKVKGDPAHPANFGKLCAKGLTVAQTLRTPNRLHDFKKRNSRQGEFTTCAPDSALQEIAQKLSTLRDEHGGDSIAFYLSGQISTEAQYVANKLAKGFLRSNHVDSNSRLCMASAAVGYKQSFGADAPMGTYADIEAADTFLIIGSSMADCHPILFQRVLAQKKKGARLIVVDPRKTETAKHADLYLPIAPGQDLSLLVGWLRYFIDHDQIEKEFLAQNTESTDWLETVAQSAEFTMDAVATQTGLSRENCEQAAQWIAEAKGFMSFWTMGLNQSRRGTAMTSAINNLHLALGKLGTPGNTPFSLTGQPNAMGGREVGYLVNGLPGQRTVVSAEDRAFTEEIWGIDKETILPAPGAHAVHLFKEIKAGNIKALWIIGTNPVASMPNNQEVKEALAAAELVIVQDAYFPTETGLYADYLLPGAVWAEAEGTMTNSDRNVTLMQQAITPAGHTTADWQLVCQVAQQMGYKDAFSYENAGQIFDELARFTNPLTGWDLSGMSYEKLRAQSLQWPFPAKSQTSQKHRYVENGKFRFAFPDGKARLVKTPLTEAPTPTSDKFPFVLTTGRLANQWHTMTKTGQVKALNRLHPAPFLCIHEMDTELLGLTDGDWVCVESRFGKAELPVLISQDIRRGTCFSPIHWNDLFGEFLCINAATSPEFDPSSFQPELKHVPVRLSKATSKHYSFTAPAETKPLSAWEQGYLAGRAQGSFTQTQKGILHENFLTAITDYENRYR